jgi:hypothetical protein
MKVNLKEMGCEDLDCVHVAQDRVKGQALVDMAVNLWGP